MALSGVCWAPQLRKSLIPIQSTVQRGVINGIRNKGLLLARAATWKEISQQASPLLPLQMAGRGGKSTWPVPGAHFAIRI